MTTPVVAVMKKDETRRFIVTSFIDGKVTMHEEGNESSPKEVIRKTFTKGYKLIEGALEDVKSEAPAEPQGDTKGAITEVSITQPSGRDMRLVTVGLADPNISEIAEADFIEELVNQHGVRHGDRVMTDEGALGHVDLNGNDPSFSMLNPVLLDETKPNVESGDDMVTINYVASGRQVRMSRKEFYKQTTAVTMKQSTDLQEDPLPRAMTNPDAPPLAWTTATNASIANADITTATISQSVPPAPPAPPVEPPKPTEWNLQPVGETPVDIYTDADEKMAQNSMRANRASKLDDAKPFKPKPFFLRQSMISSFLQCPDKMYDTYENGYSEESIFTRVGTTIHGIMEDYYNWCLEGKQPDLFDVDATFDQWWAKHAIPEWDWYRDWKGMVAKYFEKEKKYDRPQVIATELEFQTFINGVPVSGTIDRVDRVDERTIRLVDYKTNFKSFSEGELQESIQFMMYTSAIKTKELRDMLRALGDTGEFEVVICTYEMLRLGYRQTVIFPLDDITIFESWLATIWTMILSGYNRKPKLNQYCGYCQKRQRCDLYLETLKAPVSSILTENTDIEAIIEERDTLKNNEKLIKNRLSEIEGQIKAKIAENKGSMVVNGYEWGTQSGTTNTYPATDVFRILAMNGLGDLIPELVSISNTKLQSALKDRKDVLEMVEAKKVTSYKAPSLNKKKFKPAKA